MGLVLGTPTKQNKNKNKNRESPIEQIANETQKIRDLLNEIPNNQLNKEGIETTLIVLEKQVQNLKGRNSNVKKSSVLPTTIQGMKKRNGFRTFAPSGTTPPLPTLNNSKPNLNKPQSNSNIFQQIQNSSQLSQLMQPNIPQQSKNKQPNVPQPNVPQPNVPQPNVPQPNVPQPNVPQPNIPQPNVPQPNVPQHNVHSQTNLKKNNNVMQSEETQFTKIIQKQKEGLKKVNNKNKKYYNSKLYLNKNTTNSSPSTLNTSPSIKLSAPPPPSASVLKNTRGSLMNQIRQGKTLRKANNEKPKNNLLNQIKQRPILKKVPNKSQIPKPVTNKPKSISETMLEAMKKRRGKINHNEESENNENNWT